MLGDLVSNKVCRESKIVKLGALSMHFNIGMFEQLLDVKKLSTLSRKQASGKIKPS